ncbi:type I restriction enzyme EcoKI M protein [Pedobacter glucosidilyticus]|nr:class I SAM-dependent DNA methyltransferase [Pedobacter glucosidilyticus]KHJ37136.1 type I restriction enzyme EcoKI M protein [Pedobacter glucosidilyticus]
MTNFQDRANFLWSIADLLRGDYKQAEYGKVILPFTILRRLDCLLDNTKEQILQQYESIKAQPESVIDKILNSKSGFKYFHNHSKYDFEKLLAEPNFIKQNLNNYLAGFSVSVKEIFESFRFEEQIQRLDKANLLLQVVKDFNNVDLGNVSGQEMGYIFEHLIYKFAEASNETAGEHFTPREVIQLMVHLLWINDNRPTRPGAIINLYDPTSGTGGMLTEAEQYFKEHNGDSSSVINLFGQDLNEEIYAIARADLMIKGQNPENIRHGNSFSEDKFTHDQFDYMLSNPPFGVNWKKVEKVIKDEYDTKGYGGRFGAGLPSISDGSLLFLQHMVSKMKSPESGGSRIAIVFNGSPLFTGSAGSGPSDIRKWVIENDLLEGIIQLPDQLFYNTGITTYIWLITNKKEAKRKGKIVLLDASGFSQKMKRSLNNKRNYITKSQIDEITHMYGDFKPTPQLKIYDNSDFGYTRITIERPEVKNGKPVTDKNGNYKADSSLRDAENVPLKEAIEQYFKREVAPNVPDAWIDESKHKIGYEINFNREFYVFKPLRPLSQIRKDILALEDKTHQTITQIIA